LAPGHKRKQRERLLDHGVRFLIGFDDVIQGFGDVQEDGENSVDDDRRT
jgi:hypothetical protein